MAFLGWFLFASFAFDFAFTLAFALAYAFNSVFAFDFAFVLLCFIAEKCIAENVDLYE